MVQQYQSPVRVYKYPFELVMAAYEKRFPTCKMIPVFLGSDTIYEQTSSDGSCYEIHRRCRLAVDAPYLLKKIVGVDHVLFIQKNALDKRNRTLKIEAYNESFSNRVSVKEHCVYSVHPENPEWTTFEQDASLEIKHFFGFENAVEKIAIKQYTANITKGKEVMEYYITELLENNITYIPPWKPAVSTDNEKQFLDSHALLTPQNSSTTDKDSACDFISVKSHCDQTDSNGSVDKISEDVVDENIESVYKTVTNKLDTEYINKILGELSPFQESKLVQLRSWLQVNHKGKIPKDVHIYRFLKAREFQVDKAREMLLHSLTFRKKHSIDQYLTNYKPPPVISQYYAGGWHHHDKDGRPLYILRLGEIDPKGLLKSVNLNGLLKHVLTVNEEGIYRTELATKKFNKPITDCTCIVDLDGLSMRHVWRPGVKALLKIIEIVTANYPETMGRLLIVRAPRVFPVIWTLISPFIDDNTRNKFLIYGGNDYKSSLKDFIDEKFIPDFLGGDCISDMPDGGLIPKTFYKTSQYDNSDQRYDKSDGLLLDESSFDIKGLYHIAYIQKDFAHEVLIYVPKNRCVITWDFDALKGDVTFTLLRSGQSLSGLEPHEHHVSGAAGGIGSTQYTDKHMVVGVNLHIVQAPLVCREGDSVQGSHVVMAGHGSYILQWKYFDSKATFDLLSMHKSKVMYYTELLPSDKFKGSMTSLQSCHSGFSQLSATTSNSAHSLVTQSSCPSH